MDIVRIAGRESRPAKVSYVARRLVDAGYGSDRPVGLTSTEAAPVAGDLVLCRVLEIGQHRFLGQRDNRRSNLFVDDEIVVAFGRRYAPDQFEAELPADFGPCHLAAGGGIAGRVVSAHTRMASPTALQPLGLLTDEHGRVLTLRRLRRAPAPVSAGRPPTIAVLGTSMNGGKTTVVAALVRGLTAAGYRVGAVKVTGTGAPGDPSLMADSGAAGVLDFTDLGFPSTAGLDLDQVVDILRESVAHLTHEQAEVIVIEVADGLLQRETAALIRTEAFRDTADQVVFAAADSVGAIAGVRLLRGLGVPVAAVSGAVTASPLAMAEAGNGTDVPVFRSHDFASPALAAGVLAGHPAPLDALDSLDPRSGLAVAGAAVPAA